ncbi:hypothetical protein CDAR_608371 [Caerostris darwini]|uniref:Uncharacterized protein n=1 Tax=Caerostris darwini TaxID=1538125 RepID=A0AAV4U6I2_9ARAC|nr:hypothetical protein CDAR_608371 [Caerostris darwini]
MESSNDDHILNPSNISEAQSPERIGIPQSLHYKTEMESSNDDHILNPSNISEAQSPERIEIPQSLQFPTNQYHSTQIVIEHSSTNLRGAVVRVLSQSTCVHLEG